MKDESNKVRRIVITIDDYIEKHKGAPHYLSKTKIANGAKLQRTQLNKYCNNKVSRVDLDVLARICHFLQCELSDIIRFEDDEN